VVTEGASQGGVVIPKEEQVDMTVVDFSREDFEALKPDSKDFIFFEDQMQLRDI